MQAETQMLGHRSYGGTAPRRPFRQVRAKVDQAEALPQPQELEQLAAGSKVAGNASNWFRLVRHGIDSV